MQQLLNGPFIHFLFLTSHDLVISVMCEVSGGTQTISTTTIRSIILHFNKYLQQSLQNPCFHFCEFTFSLLFPVKLPSFFCSLVLFAFVSLASSPKQTVQWPVF